MFNHLKTLAGRLLAAIALASACGAAGANPVYHVVIDTHALSGNGYLDLNLVALAGASPVTATLDHFAGSYGAATFTQGQASGDTASGIVLGNGQTFNDFLQAVGFGGWLSFDVSFDTADLGNIGTHFGVALVNATLDAYAGGTGGDIASIDLLAGTPDVLSADAAFARVNVVPEPASMALLVVGLLLLHCVRRPRIQSRYRYRQSLA